MIVRPNRFSAFRLYWTMFAVIIGASCYGQGFAPENQTPATIADWQSALTDDDLAIRRKAAIATRAADRTIQIQLLPALIEILKSEKDGQIRLAVFETLTDMGGSAAKATDALVYTLRTEFGGKRNEELHQDYRSALALAAIGQPAVKGLRGLLSEETENVRAESAMALGRIGPPAASAIPDLIVLLNDKQSRVRWEASLALGRIGNAAIDPLLVASTDSNIAVRVGAIQAIGHMAENTDSRVVEVILMGARSQTPKLRAAAVNALSTVRLPDDLLRKTLLESLQFDDELVRSAVLGVLVDRSEMLKQIEPELVGLLTGDHDGVA